MQTTALPAEQVSAGSTGVIRTTVISWAVAVSTLAILVVAYVLRVASAAGVAAVPDALARFDFATWRGIDAAIVVGIAATLGTGLVALGSAGTSRRSIRVAALAFESFAAALAFAVPVLAFLLFLAFLMGPGPCSPNFYESRAPACAARDAAFLANLLLGLLALPVMGALSLAVIRLKPWSLTSAFVSALIVCFGSVAGVGTGVALSGLVPTEPFERVIKADSFMSGVVTDLRTRAPIKSRVDIFKADSPCCVHVEEAFTDVDGRYDVELPPGRYRILFVPFDWNAPVSAEWWKGANSFETASTVTIPGGGGSVNAGLGLRARVTGRVTSAATRLPISEMGVTAVVSLTGGGQNRPVARAHSDADGRYSLQLPAGTYFLQFERIGYLRSVWRDALVSGVASTVTVADRDVPNIDQVVPAPQR